MEGNAALDMFKEMLQGIYDFMQRVKIPVFGTDISLWAIFLFGAFGGFVVFVLHKIFD